MQLTKFSVLPIWALIAAFASADTFTPPLTRKVVMRVHGEGVEFLFGEFATTAAHSHLTCHPFTLVPHRENFCDLKSTVSVVGIMTNDSRDVHLEDHAGGALGKLPI